METNYFVCTLGEAAHNPEGRPFNNVPHLIRTQAENHPDLPAIGFYRVQPLKQNEPFQPEIFTFKQVHEGVVVTAGFLKDTLRGVRPGETIGLLSASSPEFMFVWLGCIWLGHPVLLIAPECAAAGIAHLCEVCKVSVLIADERNRRLGQQAARYEPDGESSKIVCLEQPFIGGDIFETFRSADKKNTVQVTPIDGDSVAYFHHTSGTSSGKPKPIPQTHRGAIGVLPVLDGVAKATFTTTPLYHGGPADTFRAWTSNAMIWLFPNKDLPITAANIMRCLECSSQATTTGLYPPVSYFGAVPYVLQMLSEEETAVEWLRSMDLVSVGGAALPDDLGNALVEQGVRLVSRFGSAECGFLLSSHRDYDHDKEWQYLRHAKQSTSITFEQREDGLSELVVLREWPHMAKRNRDDGSYATSDLFEPHPQKSDAWRYHSRADAQLTLVTGLKFDPASLEASIAAASPLVSDVLVFGNQRPYPGALLFRSKEASSIDDEQLIQDLSPIVEKCCSRGQSHAKIARSMLVPMPYTETLLEKSSKGTVLRGKAEERYAAAIDGAYAKEDATAGDEIPDDKIQEAVHGMVLCLMPAGTQIEPDVDLFNAGIDSAASIQIRKKLQTLVPAEAGRLPTSIVEDCGTVRKLSNYIIRLRHGRGGGDADRAGEVQEEMKSLVESYSKFSESNGDLPRTSGDANGYATQHTVVLTGATGALGSHVLNSFRNDPKVAKIYCLVRGADGHAAHERVSKALSSKGFPPVDTKDSKVVVLQATLADTKLGLDDLTYRQLSHETTLIMHLAWSVNFRWKLRSFAKNDLAGVQNLVNLALSSDRAHCRRLAFCSSVASVMASQANPIPETILDDPGAASDVGYSQSKWVAEQICKKASDRAKLDGRVSIFRVGQLSGDSSTGIWNSREAWPLMLSTIKLTGTLPNLADEILNWLPLDIAATALVQGATVSDSFDSALQVFHVLNNNEKPTWREMLAWLRKRAAFETVDPQQWLNALEAKAEEGSTHPALQLLDHWKKALSSTGNSEAQRPRFDMSTTTQTIPVLREVSAIDEAYVDKLWWWIDRAM